MKKNEAKEIRTLLYLDDIREPGMMTSPVFMGQKEMYEDLGFEVKVVVCKNVTDAATAVMNASGTLALASLDHDLGTKADGMDFLKWLLQAIDDKKVKVTSAFWIYFHTGNAPAKMQMDSYYKSWMKAKEL